MSTTTMAGTMRPIPPTFRFLFYLDISAVFISVICWWVIPDMFLRTVIGIAAPGRQEEFLLYLYSGVHLSMMGLMYFWFLKRDLVHRDSFRMYQASLLVNDILILLFSNGYWAGVYWDSTQRHLHLLMGDLLAVVFIVVRLCFLHEW